MRALYRKENKVMVVDVSSQYETEYKSNKLTYESARGWFRGHF